MIVLYFTIPVSICLALVFLAMFIWSVKKGHYDDLDRYIEEQNLNLLDKNIQIKKEKE